MSDESEPGIERLEILLDRVYDLIAEIRADDFTPVYFSPSHERFTGYTPEELLAMPTFSLSHPEERELQAAELAKLMADGRTRRLNTRSRHRDGHYIWLESTGSIYTTATGERRILFVSREITGQIQEETARERARAELEEEVEERTRELKVANARLQAQIEENAGMLAAVGRSERLFQTLAEISPVGIVRVDGEGQITYANRHIVEVLGREPLADESVYPDDLEEVRAYWNERVPKRRPFNHEHRIIDANGQARWVLVQVVPEPGAKSGALGWVVTLTDVTESRRVEEEKAARAEAALSSQRLESLGLLARGIAHDFNNLLSVILGNSHLLSSNLVPGSSHWSAVQEIAAAAEHASGITQQMLTYAGGGSPVLESVDLSRLIEGMMGLLRTAVSERARLRTDLSSTLPSFEGDPVQIRQVVLNLVANASESLERAGEVVVRTRTTSPSQLQLRGFCGGTTPPSGECVALQVRDSGVGLDDDAIARIFDPYFSTRFSGRGLGLATTLGIIRSHGGAIRVVSEPGRGSTFEVFLPTPSREVTHAREQRAPQVEEPGNARVLVVDDEPALLRLTSKLLGRAGFEVVTASGGREALDILTREGSGIEALVLDVAMPDVNGADVLRAVKERGLDLPIVLVSGYGEEAALQEFMASDYTAFLAKPYKPAALVAALSTSIGERREAD